MMAKSNSNQGMGLVELLVYLALILLVLSAVGGVLISMVNVQNQVLASANNAQQAQLVSRSVTTGVRNSTGVNLQTVGTADQILRVRTAGTQSTTNWICQAWYFNADSRELRFRSSPTAIATPSGSDLAGWTLLASGITGVQGQNIFALAGSKLSVVFSQQLGKESPIVIRTSASERAGIRVSAPCF